uniref:Uncharacterized protein n=1 Tax=Arundo donax TaxID=35708 RepID=A0A0A9FEP8_ARUDO
MIWRHVKPKQMEVTLYQQNIVNRSTIASPFI